MAKNDAHRTISPGPSTPFIVFTNKQEITMMAALVDRMVAENGLKIEIAGSSHWLIEEFLAKN
jgi:hypothetical protein